MKRGQIVVKMISNAKTKNERFVDFLIICCIIRPHPTFLPTVISVYLFDAVIGAILIVSMRNLQISIASLISLALLCLVACLKSIFIVADAETWLSIGKIAYYVLVYEGLRRLFAKGYSYDRLYHILNACFIFTVLLATIQILDPPVLGDVVHLLYGKTKLRSIWSGYPRIYGTFFNANWFGVYLVFMLAYYTKHFCTRGGYGKFILQMACIVVLLLFSGSRTAMIGAAIALAIVLITHKNAKKSMEVITIIGTLFVIGFVIAGSISNFSSTLDRFTDYIQGFFANGEPNIVYASGSRWATWEAACGLFIQSPLLGTAIGDTIPHNSYLSLLIYFGVLGSLLTIPAIGSVFIRLKQQPRHSDIKLLSVAFVIALAVIMTSGDYFFTTQVMLLPIILLAYGNARGKQLSSL